MIVFLGPVFGAEKNRCFASATAFVLPAVSEWLPTVVLEVWPHGLQVLMMCHCNLPERFGAVAGREIGTEVQEIGAC